MAGTSVALSTVLRVPLWLWMPLLLSCLLFLLPYSWGCLKVQTNIYWVCISSHSTLTWMLLAVWATLKPHPPQSPFQMGRQSQSQIAECSLSCYKAHSSALQEQQYQHTGDRDSRPEPCSISSWVAVVCLPVLLAALLVLLSRCTKFSLFSKSQRERYTNLSTPPKSCRGWRLNPSITLTEQGTVWAGMLQSYTCTYKEKKRSITEVSEAIQHHTAKCHKTHITWKNKKGTTLNQAEQHTWWLAACHGCRASCYHCIKELLHTCLRCCLKLLLRPRAQYYSTGSGQCALHAARSTGCGGEILSSLLSILLAAYKLLLPMPDFLSLAVTPRNHTHISLQLYKAQQLNQLTWSCRRSLARSTPAGKPRAEPWRKSRNKHNKQQQNHHSEYYRSPDSLRAGCGANTTQCRGGKFSRTPTPRPSGKTHYVPFCCTVWVRAGC